jgi:hypothetical protein
MPTSIAGNLHTRIAERLGWTEEQAKSFSLPALREMVRPLSNKLVYLIDQQIRTGEVILGERR